MNNQIIEYRTKSGKVCYRFNVYIGKDESTGKSIQVRKRGYKSQKEANGTYLNVQLSINQGKYKPINQKKYKFKEVINLWVKIYQPSVKESTFATTLRIINDHVIRTLGDVYVDKLSIPLCQRVVNSWAKASPKTYKRYIRYASKALRYAVCLEIIAKNPMDYVVRPEVKLAPAKNNNFCSKDEINDFLVAAKIYGGEKAYTFFNLLAYTGLRRGVSTKVV